MRRELEYAKGRWDGDAPPGSVGLFAGE